MRFSNVVWTENSSTAKPWHLRNRHREQTLLPKVFKCIFLFLGLGKRPLLNNPLHHSLTRIQIAVKRVQILYGHMKFKVVQLQESLKVFPPDSVGQHGTITDPNPRIAVPWLRLVLLAGIICPKRPHQVSSIGQYSLFVIWQNGHEFNNQIKLDVFM